jgi:HPt (histidine-containing phosphotransfer) domain-containing protein
MWQDIEAALIDALPKEKVSLSAAEIDRIPAGEQEKLARALDVCGVVLDNGLRYAGGDIAQYRKSAEIFISAYEAGAAAIRGLSKQEDWAGMKFHAHSLKGNARNLGANALSVTAAKLESLCETGDGAYIAALLPTLYFEWERARGGLAAFSAGLDALLPDTGKKPPQICGYDELLEMLKANQYPSAIDALGGLIRTARDPDKLEKLREIWQRTDDMKFREAERLLADLIKIEADGDER